MSKLTNVKGRINYISSHARQENLYAVYETTDRKFWWELAKCNQTEFVKSGTEGKCIEAREFIIALPESFVEYSPNKLLELFTNYFKQSYGTECIAALHHNKRKTNYHIHLIFTERKLLEEPIEKVASRNMFYDGADKHVRTKKEILDEDGQIRTGCKIIPKGEVYERNVFTTKDSRFKSDAFLEEVKKSYTELINIYVQNDKEKLKVFDRNSAYLPTKKIGKNNPKAEQMRMNNLQRERWNQTVDRALVCGIQEQQIIEIKKVQIGRKASQSIQQCGNNPDLFSNIILMAIEVLELLIVQIFNKLLKPAHSVVESPKKTLSTSHMTADTEVQEIEAQVEQIPDRPKMSVLASKFAKLDEIYEKLQQQGNAIHYKEQELEILTIDHDKCKGILKGKKRKELKEQMDKLESQIESMKRRFTGIVKEYGYPNAKAFMDEYKVSKVEYSDYRQASDSWDRRYGKDQKPMSITERIKQYKQEAKQRGNNSTPAQKKDRGAR
ncbi:MAG: MobA/MobL family protein [Lachnospiraceae bacterium]